MYHFCLGCARFTQQSLYWSIFRFSFFTFSLLLLLRVCVWVCVYGTRVFSMRNFHMRFISNIIISDFIAIRYTFFGWESYGNYRNIYFSFHISSLNKWFVSFFLFHFFFFFFFCFFLSFFIVHRSLIAVNIRTTFMPL